jgi:DNA-binding NarL/FixJ family response regulator
MRRKWIRGGASAMLVHARRSQLGARAGHAVGADEPGAGMGGGERIGSALATCAAFEQALVAIRSDLSRLGEDALRAESGALDVAAQRLDALLDALRALASQLSRSSRGSGDSPARPGTRRGFVVLSRPDARHLELSRREREIFQLLASGCTVGQIAKRLNISVKTVSTHRSHILEKLQMSNNAEITRYALEQRLV